MKKKEQQKRDKIWNERNNYNISE